MKPLTDTWKQNQRCLECGAVLDNKYECSYCGTVYTERPEPEFKTIIEEVPITLGESLGMLMLFPFSLFLIKPKTKVTKVCSNETELKRTLIKTELPHTEKKRSSNTGGILVVFIILVWLTYKYFSR